VQPETKAGAPVAALMSVREYATVTGQAAAAVRSQIQAGTCPVDVVLLRKPDPARGTRPRYGVVRASVDRLLGEASSS